MTIEDRCWYCEQKKVKTEEQLDLWVEGKSTHNEERNECCPDFSCCLPHLLAPPDIRVMFRNGNEELRFRLLGRFLSRAIASEFSDKQVYITGQEEVK